MSEKNDERLPADAGFPTWFDRECKWCRELELLSADGGTQ